MHGPLHCFLKNKNNHALFVLSSDYFISRPVRMHAHARFIFIFLSCHILYAWLACDDLHEKYVARFICADMVWQMYLRDNNRKSWGFQTIYHASGCFVFNLSINIYYCMHGHNCVAECAQATMHAHFCASGFLRFPIMHKLHCTTHIF